MASPIGSSQGKWEYQSLTRVAERPLLDALNEAGREGWELVSAAHYRDVQGLMAWTAILKRPLEHAEAAAPRRQGAAPAAAPKEPTEEDTEFEVSVPAAAARPAPRPKSPRPAPAKAPMELSDDFDFELASTTPGAQQPTKQTKAKGKPAAAEEDFDFELGESFPAKLQAAKPQAPAPKPEPEDDTDFDLG